MPDMPVELAARITSAIACIKLFHVNRTRVSFAKRIFNYVDNVRVYAKSIWAYEQVPCLYRVKFNIIKRF